MCWVSCKSSHRALVVTLNGSASHGWGSAGLAMESCGIMKGRSGGEGGFMLVMLCGNFLVSLRLSARSQTSYHHIITSVDWPDSK